MKKYVIIMALTAGLILAGLQLGCGGTTGATGTTANQDGSSQVLPTAENPIKNNSTEPGLEIAAIAVENNVDPETNKDLSDRLQLELKNTSDKTMGDFEIYYSMTDKTTNDSEGYYAKLDGLSLAAGETRTIFFDNEAAPYHYPENKYSIYRTSGNELSIKVELSTPGFKLATAEIKKDAGLEQAGE